MISFWTIAVLGFLIIKRIGEHKLSNTVFDAIYWGRMELVVHKRLFWSAVESIRDQLTGQILGSNQIKI